MTAKRTTWRALAVAAIVLVALTSGPAAAQDAPSGGEAPAIVPKPNSGSAPTDPGDRGGALQLVVLGLVVLGVGGAVLHLTRVSRQARAARDHLDGDRAP